MTLFYISEKLFLSLQVNGFCAKWTPHHDGMLHLQVADGEGLQIRRAVTDKGWFGCGLATPCHKNQSVTKCYACTQTWEDSLEWQAKENWHDI
jgi:hypothetical protein